jgi:CRISPR-associated exonuclease Cas4
MVAPPEPLPISAIEHYEYCPRQCILIHGDGVWTDNAHTVKGELGHRRVDSAGSRLERGRLVVRAVPLWSEEHGLTGRADAVEITVERHVVPVEYKIGNRHGLAAHLQLCAQALCLEEMTGYIVAEGAIWFSGPRRRIAVSIDAELRSQTLATIRRIREALQGVALPGAPNDARCAECQLIGHCLPRLVADPARVDDYVSRLLICS